MFTGLIADIGLIQERRAGADGAELRIATPLAPEISPGDSIAVNGVCLTATSVENGGFSVQAMNETLRRSSLGKLAAGSRVNLELALRATDRLGGHIVQGHVDGLAELVGVESDGFSRVLTFRAPAGLGRYIVEKGSVTLDGVSLTVSALDGELLAVSLIPETQQRTTLGGLAPGEQVNLEVDVLAKYVERLLEAVQT